MEGEFNKRMLRASFQNIQITVIENVQKASEEIKIAVAWFTNKEIFGELIERLDNKVKCTVLISDDFINKKLTLNIDNQFNEEDIINKVIKIEVSHFYHLK